MVASSPFWVHFWLAGKTGSYRADSDIPVRQLKPKLTMFRIRARSRTVQRNNRSSSWLRPQEDGDPLSLRAFQYKYSTRRSQGQLALPFCPSLQGWLSWVDFLGLLLRRKPHLPGGEKVTSPVPNLKLESH